LQYVGNEEVGKLFEISAAVGIDVKTDYFLPFEFRCNMPQQTHFPQPPGRNQGGF